MVFNATSGSDYVFIGNIDATGSQFAAISDAPAIDLSLYQPDVTFTFSQRVTDDGTNSSPRWRVVAKVGSTWFASNEITGNTNANPSTSAVAASAAVWGSWEPNLADGFNTSSISMTKTALSGTITEMGILAIDGTDNNDRLRLFSYEVSGTAVPEPSSALLGGLGLLALLHRRR